MHTTEYWCVNADGEVWIEHGYLVDVADLKQHSMGQQFLKDNSVACDELVNSQTLYHSPARVIEGELSACAMHCNDYRLRSQSMASSGIMAAGRLTCSAVIRIVKPISTYKLGRVKPCTTVVQYCLSESYPV